MAGLEVFVATRCGSCISLTHLTPAHTRRRVRVFSCLAAQIFSPLVLDREIYTVPVLVLLLLLLPGQRQKTVGLSCSCCTPRCSSKGLLSTLAWASVKTTAASVHFCSSVSIDHSQITDSQFVSSFLSWSRFSRNFHDLIFLSLALERAPGVCQISGDDFAGVRIPVYVAILLSSPSLLWLELARASFSWWALALCVCVRWALAR